MAGSRRVATAQATMPPAARSTAPPVGLNAGNDLARENLPRLVAALSDLPELRSAV